MRETSRFLRILLGFLSLVLASAVWLPLVHVFFAGSTSSFFTRQGLAPEASALAERHLAIWKDPETRKRELDRMRQSNPEWDFMWRTFFAWSLAEMALRDPAFGDRCLPVMDEIIEDTLRLEREKGPAHFLMGYARSAPYFVEPRGCQFVDGEIAMMLALRRLAAEKEEYRAPLSERVEKIAARMRKSPVLCAESYPNECWIFDNVIALAAVRIADVLDGTDHSDLIAGWVTTARAKLLDAGTSLLISHCTVKGTHGDGPEGSSIWMIAHHLRLLDGAFARDQYDRARTELARLLLGFGFSREWPASRRGPMDIDSGAIIPFLDAGVGASGMAFIAAASFEDEEYLSALLASLRCAGFPSRDGEKLRFAASNPVGDAALLYACVLGPAWREAERRAGLGKEKDK